MSSSSVLPAESQEVLTFARLCPLADGDVDHESIEYEILRDADEDDEDDPDEEILQLSIPEEQRNTVGGKETVLYSFDGVLRDDATQEDVFQTVALDTVDSCLRGFSGSILAYGQTNSGKTWTVTGGEGFEERGLAPRAIGHLFREMRNAETSEVSVSYEVRASYLEVYEDRVYDLLDVSNRDKPMEEWATVTPLDDGEGSQVLKGLTTFEVDNEEDTLNLFFMGNSHRVMGETPANRASSRSHAVFTLSISSSREEDIPQSDDDYKDDEDKSETRTIVSQCELTLVDLAGCERMYKNDWQGYSVGLDDAATLELLSETGGDASALEAHGARKAAREREGKKINSALQKLETVIRALQNPGAHIPYRESTLTSVLRASLGRECRPVFVVTLSVDADDLAETVASCRFAQSCRKAVVCQPVADEHLEPAEELRLLRREADDLKAALATKDDLLRELAEEVAEKHGNLEAVTKKLEASEAAHAFHTTRSPSEEDKGACAVLAQALADGSDEAEEALEELDRVSALQCCRKLQEIVTMQQQEHQQQQRDWEQRQQEQQREWERQQQEQQRQQQEQQQRLQEEEQRQQQEQQQRQKQEQQRQQQEQQQRQLQKEQDHQRQEQQEEESRARGVKDDQMQQHLSTTLRENADLQVEVKQLQEQVQALEEEEEEERLAQTARPPSLLQDGSAARTGSREVTMGETGAATAPAAPASTTTPALATAAQVPSTQRTEQGTDPGSLSIPAAVQGGKGGSGRGRGTKHRQNASTLQASDLSVKNDDGGDFEGFLNDEDDEEEGKAGEEEGEDEGERAQREQEHEKDDDDEEEEEEEEEEPLTTPTMAAAELVDEQPPGKGDDDRGNNVYDSEEGLDGIPGVGSDGDGADGDSSQSEMESGAQDGEDEEEEEEVVPYEEEDDDGDNDDVDGDGEEEETRGGSDEEHEQEGDNDDSLDGDQEEEEEEEEEDEEEEGEEEEEELGGRGKNQRQIARDPEPEAPSKGPALGEAPAANSTGASRVRVSSNNGSSSNCRRRSSRAGSSRAENSSSSARNHQRRDGGDSTNSSLRSSAGSFSSGKSGSAASGRESRGNDGQSSLAGGKGEQGASLESDEPEEPPRSKRSTGANRNTTGEGTTAATGLTKGATGSCPTSPEGSDSGDVGSSGGGFVGTRSQEGEGDCIEEGEGETGWGEVDAEEQWEPEADRGRRETATATTTRTTAAGGHRTSDSTRFSRTNLQRGLGTHDVTARGEVEKGNVQPAGRPSSPSHRRNLARNLGTRDFGSRDFGTSPVFSSAVAKGLDNDNLDEGGRPPPLALVVEDDSMMSGRDGAPLLYRTTPGDGGGHSALGSKNNANVAYDDERQRTLLTGGGFFVMHGRFSSPQMRFVWMSRDLGSILWRCCGHTAVKGSAQTTMFDFVHLGVHKGTAAASTTSAASSAGKALKQIVLTGGAGRNRLVLELDGGNTEADADVVQTWFEAFNYAVNFANTEVITKMLQPSGRRSTLSQSDAIRRGSLSATLPAPRTQAHSATAATDRGGNRATKSGLGQSMPAETFAASGWAAGGAAGGTSAGPKSRPLAALRPVPSSSLLLPPSPPSLPPPPPPRSGTEADDVSSSGSAGAGGDGSVGDDSSTVMRTAASTGANGSQASVFARPPPIDTSSLVGARGPSSPPPRGKHTGPLTPSPRGESTIDRHGESEEGKERRRFMKTLATEAAAVITMRTLNPTRLHSSAPCGGEGETSSPSGGDGGGDGGGGSPSTSSYRSYHDSSTHTDLAVPFRQLIAHHAPSVADHHHPPERPTSPRARVGAVRRGSGCDGIPLTGIRRRGSGSGVDAESARPSVADHPPAGRPSSPRARPGAERRGSGSDGVPLSGIRRRGSGSGTSINMEIAGDGARWAGGKQFNGGRQGSRSGGGDSEARRGSGGGGGGGIRWANGKPFTGILRRGSGDETDAAQGGGIRWASSKPAISTRPNIMRSADPYRDRPDIPKAVASDGRLAAETEASASQGSRGFGLTDPRHNAARKGSSVGQGREGAASPTRALARATARRLSALGAKAVGGMGLGGGTATSSNGGSDPSAISTRPPPSPPATTSGVSTGSGSPGAKGEGPPPPPSREQRRRMSAAPLTEQQLHGVPDPRRGYAASDAIRAS